MDYNKIIIVLVIILAVIAVVGFAILNQNSNNTTNITNSTNTTNVTNVTKITNNTDNVPESTAKEVSSEQSTPQKRTYADIAHDSDVHTNPEKSKELNDNIVGGKDGIYYFSDGSYVDMR